MASSLTSTNQNSSKLYLLFLILVTIGIAYLFFLKKPDASVGFQRQAFKLNASAFANGIYLANMRFIVNDSNNSTKNQWLDDEIGLDYNSNGFPIGTDIENLSQETPMTAENCRQVWKFVLSRLQPKVYLNPVADGYWVEITKDKVCIFRAFNLQKMQLSYQSLTGKVLLTE